MSLTSHILVPTDFSKAAQPALTAAATLARQSDAKVTLLHVFDPSALSLGHVGLVPHDSEIPTEADVDAQIREALAQLADAHFEGIEGVETLIGNAASAPEEIIASVARIGADLIVMATNGRDGVGQLIIGSVTERVVRHAPCPILVIPTA